jgi:signal transduction histidine kinase
MFTLGLDRRMATTVRLAGLALIIWSVAGSGRPPAPSGRGLVVAIALILATAASLVWLLAMARESAWASVIGPDLYLMAGAGGALTAACPGSAASAFVFVAVVSAALRRELVRALPVGLLGALALALGDVAYRGDALGLLAYSLGLAAAALAASNSRQTVVRAEQAELLLAQAQRSHEEQLRTARLEESARIARDIHDVLAHALAGLTIQLEATALLVEQGADTAAVLDRVRRAHGLAREGLLETRRAVGALRGDAVAAAPSIEELAREYRSASGAPARLRIDGDRDRLAGPVGEALLRVVQEALTNVRKHAPGAEVEIEIAAGDDVRAQIVSRGGGAADPALGASGGGYGVRGMQERAALLGGTVQAGPVAGGWRVELALPAGAAERRAEPVR